MIKMRALLLGLCFCFFSMASWAGSNAPTQPVLQTEPAIVQTRLKTGLSLPENAVILGFETDETTLRLKLTTDFDGYMEIIAQLPLAAVMMSVENRSLLGEAVEWWDVNHYDDLIASLTPLANQSQLTLGLSVQNGEQSDTVLTLFMLFHPE